MIRIIALAAAATLVAGAASAQATQTADAHSIRVSTAGKSADQVKAEVYQAARKLCQDEVAGYAYRVEEARVCIANTTRDTLAQSQTQRVATR